MSQCAQRRYNSTPTEEKDRNLAIAGPLVRGRGGRRRGPDRPAREVQRAGLARRPARRRGAGAGADDRVGRRAVPRARCLAGRGQHRRACGGGRQAAQHVRAGRPDGEIHAAYRKIHLFDVEVGGVDVSRVRRRGAGRRGRGGRRRRRSSSGMAVCYDLRFPELFRIMAVRGARVVSLPAAFTVPTGRAHWEVLVRARAIENQAFMIAAGQIGSHPPRSRELRAFDDRRPLGSGARAGAGRGVLRRGRPRPRCAARGAREAAFARRTGSPHAYAGRHAGRRRTT